MAVGKTSSVAAWKAQHEKGQVYLLSFRKHRSHLFDHGSWFRILSIQIPVVQRDFLQQTSLLVIALDVLWLELLLDSLRTSARHFFEYHHNASDCMTTVAKSRWFVMIRYIDCIFLYVSYFLDLGKATATLNRWTSKQAAANYQPFSFLSGSSWVARTWMGSMEMCRGHGILSNMCKGDGEWQRISLSSSWLSLVEMQICAWHHLVSPLLLFFACFRPQKKIEKQTKEIIASRPFKHTNCFTLFASLCIQFRFKSCTMLHRSLLLMQCVWVAKLDRLQILQNPACNSTSLCKTVSAEIPMKILRPWLYLFI